MKVCQEGTENQETNLHINFGVAVQSNLCPTLCNPMNCSLSGSSVLGFYYEPKMIKWKLKTTTKVKIYGTIIFSTITNY